MTTSASPDDPGCETTVSFLPLNVTIEKQHVSRANNTSNDKVLKQPDDIYCGYGSCRPAFAQRFGTISWFTAVVSASSLVTWTLQSYMNSQITSLEKHFNINSSTSGFLLSCNDLGFLVTTLVLSYYTRRLHIPRSLGYTTILFGAAGLLCTVAFLGTRDRIPSPPKESQDVTEDLNTHLIQMCSNQTLLSQDMDNCEETLTTTRTPFQISDTWRKLAIFILALSMILQGMAKAPRTPFTTTYIDDNVPRTKTALYLGIITAVGIAGSSISFALGGVFSSFYVTLEETSISQRDPRWIGAWWIGFLLFGSLGIVAGIPLLFFPKRLRAQANLKVAMEARQKQLQTRTRIFRDVTDFLKSLRRILTNPVFMCLVIGSGLNLMALAGVLAFLPKYLETQFSVSASRANLAVGINNLISFSIVTPLSGYVVSRFKFSPVTCLKFLVGCLIIIVAISSLGFVLGCRQPVIHTGVATDSHGVQNISRCVHTCNCDSQNFFPVCGGDGRNYFSPCHAGCTSMDPMGFSNCSCLVSSESTIATGGFCVPDCNNFYPYMAVIFGVFAVSCFACIPAFIATMRSVGEVDKPISIGVNTLMNSLLGWFPAPMVFGSMIDKTCLSWKQSCTSVGACSLYDIELFRFRFHMMVIGLISITIILYSTALTIAVCSKREVFQPNTDEYFVIRKEAKDQLTIALDESLSTSARSRIRK